MGLLSTNGSEKYAAKPVQFGAPPAFLASFDERFCFANCLESFRSTIREVKGFGLSASRYGTNSIDPVAIQSSIPPKTHEMPSTESPEALRAQPR